MTNLDGTTTEPCRCRTSQDGRCLVPCQACLKAALAERTHGIAVFDADGDPNYAMTTFLEVAEALRLRHLPLWQRFRAWLSSL